MRPFRFGVNMLSAVDRQSWTAKCRRAEQLGYDVILVPDHLGNPAPFPSVVAAAEATKSCKVGTFVINTPIWNAALLGREIITADRLTGGRLEIGLGIGRDRADHDAAGVAWLSAADRIERLENVLRVLTGDEAAGHRPGLPVLVAGNGQRMLELAARHADIVAFRPVGRMAGDSPGVTRLLDAATLAERVACFRTLAGGRADHVEANILVRTVIPTLHRRAEAERARTRFPHLSADALLETPALLIGTVLQMAAQLRERREAFGFSYLVVQEPSMEALAPVIEALAGDRSV